MRIEIEISEIRELAEVGLQLMRLLPTETSGEYPEDIDECCEDETADLGPSKPVTPESAMTEEAWARARELAGLNVPRRRRDFVISPDKVADIDVYIRVANELGEFGPKFLRDRWQEIKAMYAVYIDEGIPGIPGRKSAPLSSPAPRMTDPSTETGIIDSEILV